MKGRVFLSLILVAVMGSPNCTQKRLCTTLAAFDETTTGAAIDRSAAFLLAVTETDIRLLALEQAKPPWERVTISEMENASIACGRDACWVGGGRLGAGQLISVTIPEGTTQVMNSHRFTQVDALALSGDGSWLATGHANGVIILWDLGKWEQKAVLGDRESEVYAVAFSADGKQLYSGDGNGDVVAWDTEDFTKLKSLRLQGESIFTIAVNGRAGILVCGGSRGTLHVVDSDTFTAKSRIDVGSEALLHCDCREPDSKVVCGMTNGYIGLLNDQGTDMTTRRVGGTDVVLVRFVDNGDQVLSVDKRGTIQLLDAGRF